MSDIIIIGGGAAGMYCGIMLGDKGHRVTLIEQNEKLGKKLFITGKGRCNFTNDCTRDVFFENVVTNPRFLYGSYPNCTPQDIIEQFESWGLKTKVERGQRAFPESDHAYDVIDVLKKQLKKNRVKVLLNTQVRDLVVEEGMIKGIVLEDATHTVMKADAVVMATGGMSYPSTGSRGWGHNILKKYGHTICECRPSLTGLNCSDQDLALMQGLSLKNVTLRIPRGKKTLYEGFGEMMFTHFGITGPLVLSASALTGKYYKDGPITGYIDLKPAVSEEKLDANLLKLFGENENKDIAHVIRSLYPSSMVQIILDRAGIAGNKKIHDVTKAERQAIIKETKAMEIHMTGVRGFPEAIITQGGVSVKEVTPSTMESRLIGGLYIIGELLDLDAMTGGFNLQIAWMTANTCAGAIW
ncbi:MAG: NAD(P)/FAD-dependent oxidoreductase [Lachnospiraceae bacterium]|nr:NAD(P)/FAD-dependent oxidoreductase [Candidatus Equihabitans merdae]